MKRFVPSAAAGHASDPTLVQPRLCEVEAELILRIGALERKAKTLRASGTRQDTELSALYGAARIELLDLTQWIERCVDAAARRKGA